MGSRIYDRLRMPAACWEEPEMLDALAARNVGHVFRTAQRLTGASQTQIGVATGLSQAQVSEIMGRKRQVTTIDVIARIVTGLGIPEPARSVLLLGDRQYANQPGLVPLPRISIELPPAPSEPSSDYGDVTAVYATRSEFMSRMPPHSLLDGAREVRASGLSLNMICQNYADNHLIDLVNRGTRMRCLFLDPQGEAIRAREREEGYAPGFLVNLTDLNIQNMLRRVRDRLDESARGNLEIGVYDETIRFNVLLLDDSLCVVQPYMPEVRGVDSPTLVMRRRPGIDGLFATFDGLFTRLWQRSRTL